MKVVIAFGMDCKSSDPWVPDEVKQWQQHSANREFDVRFYFPPVHQGERQWHPYTPKWDEHWKDTHRALDYSWHIETTAAELWNDLDEMEAVGEDFVIVAYSNAGAVGFEIAKHFAKCVAVLWVASVPVLSQQRRSSEITCPKAFLHGTLDEAYFGGHATVLNVAKEMDAEWFEYEGGHSNVPVCSVINAVQNLLSDRRIVKRRRCCL